MQGKMNREKGQMDGYRKKNRRINGTLLTRISINTHMHIHTRKHTHSYTHVHLPSDGQLSLYWNNSLGNKSHFDWLVIAGDRSTRSAWLSSGFSSFVHSAHTRAHINGLSMGTSNLKG